MIKKIVFKLNFKNWFFNNIFNKKCFNLILIFNYNLLAIKNNINEINFFFKIINY